MKKLNVCIVMAALTIFFFQICGFAEYLSYGSGENQITLYQQLKPANLQMYKDWLSADIVTEAIGGTFMNFQSPAPEPENNYDLEPLFFFEFDYVTNVSTKLLKAVHGSDVFSIYDKENAKFEIKYIDPFLEQSAGYPKLVLFLNGVFHSSRMLDDAANNSYEISLPLEKGEYKYQYITTNDEYNLLLGTYSISGNWYVTSLPYGFERISPQENSKELPLSVRFKWDVLSDEGDLFYEFYLGFNSAKSGLEKFSSAPAVNAKEFVVLNLSSVRQYYWYMKIKNKHGAFIETDLFTFYTGGNVEKFYNAPNPFNPARGQKTQFVFNMPESGTVKLSLYSEYGDKVYESEIMNVSGGDGNAKTILYNGKDNSGRTLYNGSYLAVLTKKYAGQTKTERCRILIIK
ncbi:MAG: hypothetical protein LBO62_07435 [Endomicrobium sp.]|jgi:hypothetical protein|nr:hypothetical protein [Endomicrobium sp.]